jgi:hypothetical protein
MRDLQEAAESDDAGVGLFTAHHIATVLEVESIVKTLFD